MNRNIIWAGLIILVLLVAGGWWAFGRNAAPQEERGNVAEEIAAWKEYRNDELKLAFRYPPDYYLEEKTVNTAQRLHKQIILTEDTEENRAIREGRGPAGEGPVAITVDVYQNNLDKQSALQWARNTSASNFKLANGDFATTTLNGRDAVAYTWSGLYEGDTIAISTPDYVYAFSATYIGPEDRIRQDFVKVLATSELR